MFMKYVLSLSPQSGRPKIAQHFSAG